MKYNIAWGAFVCGQSNPEYAREQACVYLNPEIAEYMQDEGYQIIPVRIVPVRELDELLEAVKYAKEQLEKRFATAPQGNLIKSYVGLMAALAAFESDEVPE